MWNKVIILRQDYPDAVMWNVHILIVYVGLGLHSLHIGLVY